MTSGNVLITSAGAKTLLVRAFQSRNAGAKAFTADIEAQCAAGFFGDGHVQVKRQSDPGALEELTAVCRDHGVRLIVPTRDGELAFFADNKDAFAKVGTHVLVPSPEALAACQNKRAFGARLEEHELRPVPEIDPDASQSPYPMFIRPVTGAGGRGAQRIEGPNELPGASIRSNYLIHPFIDAREYSIDLLMDLEGRRALQCVVRERLMVVAGESKVSRVVSHPEMEAQALKLGESFGLVGHNVVQAFDDPERGILFIEVNPRFGGASNLSIQAGLASPERILQMLSGDHAAAAAKRDIKIGATMYRYSEDMIIDKTP